MSLKRVPFSKSWDSEVKAIADAHVTRVTNDGGVIPDYNRLCAAIKSIYHRIPDLALLADPHIFGYKATGDFVDKQYSLISGSDLTFGTDRPMLHKWEGENYYNGVGINGNRCESGSTALDTNINNLDISVFVEGNALTSSTASMISKAGVFDFRFYPTHLQFRINHTTTLISNFVLSDIKRWVRVTFRETTGDCKFFTSLDGTNWTHIDTITIVPTEFVHNINKVRIAANTETQGTFDRGIYSAQIYNGIREEGGSLAVSFNANDYRKSDPTNFSTFTSSQTGEVWTINTGTAATGYKGVMVDRTYVQYDGVNDNMKTPAMTLNQPVTSYVVGNVFNGVAAIRRLWMGTNVPLGHMSVRFDNTTTITMTGSDVRTAPFLSGDYKKWLTISSTHLPNNGLLWVNQRQLILSPNNDIGNLNPISGINIGSRPSNPDTEYLNFLQSTLIFTKTADNHLQRQMIQAAINSNNIRLW